MTTVMRGEVYYCTQVGCGGSVSADPAVEFLRFRVRRAELMNEAMKKARDLNKSPKDAIDFVNRMRKAASWQELEWLAECFAKGRSLSTPMPPSEAPAPPATAPPPVKPMVGKRAIVP